jgi:hypothetical protein
MPNDQTNIEATTTERNTANIAGAFTMLAGLSKKHCISPPSDIN